MRYTNITDKQRHFEKSQTYDDKFHKTYQSFSLNKSKIGQAKISPLKDSGNLDLSSTFS